MAQAGPAPSISCPAARLARDAAALILRLETLEATSDVDTRALQDRLDAITDAASYVAAESPLGAYFQALLAAGDTDADMPWVIDSPSAARAARRVERLARSSAAYLLRRTGEPATTLALAAFYTPASEWRQLA